jgi:hypothetical protein
VVSGIELEFINDIKEYPLTIILHTECDEYVANSATGDKNELKRIYRTVHVRILPSSYVLGINDNSVSELYPSTINILCNYIMSGLLYYV